MKRKSKQALLIFMYDKNYLLHRYCIYKKVIANFCVLTPDNEKTLLGVVFLCKF